MAIEWESGPPRKNPLAGVRLVVPGTEAARFILLGPSTATQLHWLQDAGRSRPCLGAGCPYCPAPARRKVYLPALHLVQPKRVPPSAEENRLRAAVGFDGDAEAKRQLEELLSRQHGGPQQPLGPVPVVLEITENAEQSLTDRECRGLLVETTRSGHNRNAALRLTVLRSEPADILPEAFDVKPVLLRLWGMRDEAPPPRPGVVPFRKTEGGGAG